MADATHGVMINEILGRFIEESVNRAIDDRLTRLTEETETRMQQVIDSGAERFEATIQRASDELQIRIYHMVEQGLHSLTAEGERLVQQTCDRIVETAQKSVEDLPVIIQESLMEMTQENEILFRQRSVQWIGQLQDDALAGMDELRAKFLEETAQAAKAICDDTAASAKAICDRNLFDVRSDFENHVHRCFQGAAERLAEPFNFVVQASPENPAMRQ